MWWQIASASVGLILLFDGSLLGLLYVVHWTPSQNESCPPETDFASGFSQGR